MTEEDINNVSIACNIIKVRYDNLDAEFREDYDAIIGTNCFVAIDITNVLKNLALLREGIIDDKDFDYFAIVSILNVYAHYKHYFVTRKAHKTIIIGFVKDGYTYNKNKKIMDALCDYCNFFPSVYTIPNIVEKGLHSHVVSTIFEYLNTFPLVLKPGQKRRSSNVFVISGYQPDRQLMCLFPTKIACTIYKNPYTLQNVILTKENYMRNVMKHKDYYDHCPYKAMVEYSNVLIGKYFNTMKFTLNAISKNDDSTQAIRFRTSSVKGKLELLTEFLEKRYIIDSTDSLPCQFIDFLEEKREFENASARSKLIKYEAFFDYRFQDMSYLRNVIKPLLDSWSTKIKDYEMNRESETYKKLIEMPIYTNWLLEEKEE